jgi:hypothetical protein
MDTPRNSDCEIFRYGKAYYSNSIIIITNFVLTSFPIVR